MNKNLQKKAGSRLIINEDDSYFLNCLINNLPHYIFWKDRNLVFRGCNQQFAAQFGYRSPKNIIGKTDYDFPWAPHLRDKYIHDDENILSTGMAKLNYEEQQRQADGAIKTVLVSKAPVYNNAHVPIGIIGIYTDITERKQIEQLQREMTQKTSKYMEMLAGSIAHELRTPLAIISVHLDVLRKDLSEGKDSWQKPIDVIRKVIKSAAYVIDNILVSLRTLAIGKPCANDFKCLAIADAVGAVLANYPFRGNEAELIQWRKSNLFMYKGDDVLTQHVLFNLIKNSLRAIKEVDKGKIVITQKVNKQFNQLILTDTAKGIAASYVPKIFDQFESQATLQSGAGLGLAFCKAVMQMYGGTIVCKSKENKYTKFILSFPKI